LYGSTRLSFSSRIAFKSSMRSTPCCPGHTSQQHDDLRGQLTSLLGRDGPSNTAISAARARSRRRGFTRSAASARSWVGTRVLLISRNPTHDTHTGAVGSGRLRTRARDVRAACCAALRVMPSLRRAPTQACVSLGPRPGRTMLLHSRAIRSSIQPARVQVIRGSDDFRLERPIGDPP
jgi:hypothetical protein